MAKKEIDPAPPAAPAPSTVSLKNTTRQSLVFNLPHAEYCRDVCSCEKQTRTIEEYDYRNEEHVAKVVERLICGSISWLAGETKEVDPRVFGVRHIFEACQRGELVTVPVKA